MALLEDDVRRLEQERMKTVLFFPNGQTVVTNGREQIPELQQSWLVLFLKFLESRGEDPTRFEFKLPSGRTALVFKTDSGYNYQFLGEVDGFS